MTDRDHLLFYAMMVAAVAVILWNQYITDRGVRESNAAIDARLTRIENTLLWRENNK